jgi:molybdopterin molybdotransferase
VPNGADAIVIQENADQADGAVTIKEVEPGRHIRPRGQDFAEGDVLLHRGTRLGPRELMLAAAMNHAELPVRRRPKVAILSTGDEVVPPGSPLGPDEIVASVSYGLAALVAANGGVATSLGIAKDTPEDLLALIRAGSGADILVTIGGASVGDRDLVGAALRAEGLDLEFWKIAMRPGKPLLYGRLGSQRVLGVPGNPVAALICGLVFLVPMLRRLLGLREDDRRAEAVLGEDLEANGPRQHYLRATSAWDPGGERVVVVLPAQDSSLMADFARADCLIVRPSMAPALARGGKVTIIPLDA